jgi:pyruvate-ferredoxin/flavodoxin oxidoreductase
MSKTEKRFITCDGNHAAAHVAYAYSEVAAIYPITPSSNMAENVDEWSANGLKNMFGETMTVTEMQSEAGAAGAVHGSLQAGALTTTFTASQGLLLMIPNMYKIAGELLPCVFHVSARSLAAQALSIFGDHQDVMAARQTGFAMLATGSVQEIMDIAPAAHLATLKTRIPFMHFFDGFRTSHEIQKVEYFTTEELASLVDQEALQAFRDNALNPENPVTRGTAQNPDIYFQTREASNQYYDAIPDVVNEYLEKLSEMCGRDYKPFNYYGAEDAEYVIVAMGSVTETLREAIDFMVAQGQKVGMIAVHLYRPFSAKYFMNVFPASTKRVCVLDRTKEPGANGEPLYLDVREMFFEQENAPMVIGGRYGLSSKDTTPAQMISVYENLMANEPKNHFTVGIVDDVTFHSLPLKEEISVVEGTYEAKFYGLGADGTVGANKNSIKIIGDNTDKYAQAYFSYDSKKSGGITISHLRFGDDPIRSTYLVNTPNFVACHTPSYIWKYDMLKGLRKGGTYLMNSIWDKEETVEKLPASMKKYMAENDIKFFIINATKIAKEIGLGSRINTIMQSDLFNVNDVVHYELAVEQMKKMIVKSFGRKGEEIVNMNYAAVDNGGQVEEITVDPAWANLTEEVVAKEESNKPAFITNIVEPINNLEGDLLPVSAFAGYEDGTFPAGTSAFEKRGIAVSVPEWQPDTCIQCNQCAYVCPHACIRPFVLSEEEAAAAPEGYKMIDAKGKEMKGMKFSIQVSPLDCTGCDNCVQICPTKQKSLVMDLLDNQRHEGPNWDYSVEAVKSKAHLIDTQKTVKNSQFATPLFEFSGACSGCGETPYIKLITQLFGERMSIANATGCSSIYGGSAPSTPYTTNENGHGPAWANSLFEDNAEFGYGMAIAQTKLRDRLVSRMEAAVEGGDAPEATKEAFKTWLETKEDNAQARTTTDTLLAAIADDESEVSQDVKNLKQFLVKKSAWIFGGDGWAYDIGYGGVDHVLASGENVNMLVMDTEVYSNTGGQSSKATPVGAVAKFAASGKKIRKKDLGMMAISYGYVYVAQVAIGSSQAQYLKALREAEAYDGPSLIIAYSPCIAHGLRSGMGNANGQTKDAVECGYWSLYRYDPRLEGTGKNPFQLDSKPPKWEKFQDFLHSEVRYTALAKAFPAEAKELFLAAQENAKWRHDTYVRHAAMDWSMPLED